MRFKDSDVKPNPVIDWDQIHVGSTGDARWRAVPAKVRRIDSLAARPPITRHGLTVKKEMSK